MKNFLVCVLVFRVKIAVKVASTLKLLMTVSPNTKVSFEKTVLLVVFVQHQGHS